MHLAEILNAIRKELRQRDYLPVLFDFEKPASRDFTETVSTLAHLARFIIVDITEARSVPQDSSLSKSPGTSCVIRRESHHAQRTESGSNRN